MTLDLIEYMINTKNVVENIVKDNEANIEFFFIEHTKTLLCIFMENLTVQGSHEYNSPRFGCRMRKGFIFVDSRKVCQGSSINVLVRSLPFILGNQSALEELESLRHAQDLPWSRLPTD